MAANFVGYARVSSKSDLEGLAGQIERIQKWAKYKGHNCEIVDEVASAAKGKPRPKFENLMIRIEKGDWDGLVVDTLDRFGRSVVDVLHHVTRIQEAGKAFVSVRHSIDTSTPMGKMLFTMTAAFAEMERELINERMALGRERARRRGKRLGGPKPKSIDRDSVIMDLRSKATFTYLANKWGVSISTIKRRIKIWREDLGLTDDGESYVWDMLIEGS